MYFRDFYERDALMMSEEGIIVGGLLVGLNVIDCNLCVKEEDLDYQVMFHFLQIILSIKVNFGNYWTQVFQYRC